MCLRSQSQKLVDIEAEDGELLPEALPIGGLEVALQVCQQAVELLTQPAREQGHKASALDVDRKRQSKVTM